MIVIDKENELIKSGLFCVLCLFALVAMSACDKEKQASAEIGAVPKQTIDAAAAEINAASAAAAASLNEVEKLDAEEEVQN